ncbi:hypothetical protein EYF80_030753 [Liparis tanakae]|uniref:Uncharacterized protein n=1 Tax=Liparis tanakae TaxID=230148 RepID=A0A4Z2H0Z1_9TELE|nr:hypothetical protein EYF80_030753 [Liparis tanakae]
MYCERSQGGKRWRGFIGRDALVNPYADKLKLGGGCGERGERWLRLGDPLGHRGAGRMEEEEEEEEEEQRPNIKQSTILRQRHILDGEVSMNAQVGEEDTCCSARYLSICEIKVTEKLIRVSVSLQLPVISDCGVASMINRSV